MVDMKDFFFHLFIYLFFVLFFNFCFCFLLYLSIFKFDGCIWLLADACIPVNNLKQYYTIFWKVKLAQM